jgi:hypothetical protein
MPVRTIPICISICLCLAGLAPGDGQRPHVNKRTLDQPAGIQGYPCARGIAWFYDDGKLESCRTSRETPFAEARVPAGSWIQLTPGGQPRFVFLHHDTRIGPYTCRGEGHGFTTAFFPSGRLEGCWLADDEEIQGTPCGRGSFSGDVFGGGSSTQFYESGMLRACRLSKSALIQDHRFSRGARVAFDPDGRIK